MAGVTSEHRTHLGFVGRSPKANNEYISCIMVNKKTQPLEHTPLWERPGYLVRRLHQIHVGLFFELCGEHAITPVQYGMLTILRNSKEQDQTSLANELGVDRTSVADVLQRLEKRNLIKRRTKEGDRRAKSTSITPRGSALIKLVDINMLEAQARLLEPLNEDEREQFISLMLKLVDANNSLSRAPRMM